MPTGYTAGIIDGTITTFEEFAEKCTRAFLVHMKEENSKSEFKECKPSGYHENGIKDLKKDLEKLNHTSNFTLKKEMMNFFDEQINSCEKHIKNKKELADKLGSFLAKALLFRPPTEEHTSISEFMIEQIRDTIKLDCDYSFYSRSIDRLKKSKENFNVSEHRKKTKKEIETAILDHQQRLADEVEACKKTNKWYYDFIDSLK